MSSPDVPSERQPAPSRGSVGRAVIWVTIEKWTSRILSLAVFAILTRLIDADSFGLVSMASVALAFVMIFVDSGFSKALIQRETLDDRDASTSFWTSLLISVVLAGGLVAAAPLIAAGYGNDEVAPVLSVLSLALPLAALSGVPAAILERTLEFRALALRQMVGTSVGAAVAVPLAFMGYGVWALVAQTLVSLAASVVMLWSSTRWRPSFTYSFEALRGMWKFATSFLGIELLNTFQMNIDKLVIGVFLGPTALGYYYVGQRAVVLLTDLIGSILSRVSLTTFSRLQGDRQRTIYVLGTFVFISGAVSVPVFGITAFLAPQIIPFLFGSGWAITALIFQLLAPSAALNSMTSIDKNVMLAGGHNRSALTIGISQLVLGTALIAAAVPFGVIGVAASRSLLAALLIPLRAFLLRRTVGMPVRSYLGRLLICGAALLPSAVLLFFLQQTAWAHADHAFWTFAVPAAAIALVIYIATLIAICGPTYRRLLLSPIRAALRRRSPAKD